MENGQKCKLFECSEARVNEVIDLLERMSTGKPPGWRSRSAPVVGSVQHCPYYCDDGTVPEACQDGCRLIELID